MRGRNDLSRAALRAEPSLLWNRRLAVWIVSEPLFRDGERVRATAQVRTSVEIDIDRRSDQSENDQLAEVFRRSGVEAALRELTNGSRYLLLLVDPFTADDFFQGTKSPGSELAAIVIWLGRGGEGEGQIAPGSRIGIDAFGAVTVDVRDPMIVFPHVGRQR
jgi:hypothetical protein